MPEADVVLQRHINTTHQCELLSADTYILQWEAIVSDGNEAAKMEQVRQQGRQGKTFTRIHQTIKPAYNFVAFGRAKSGDYWSAGARGVVGKLPESVGKSMMPALDPTPVCGFQARWPQRTNLGDGMIDNVPQWHLVLTWADNNTTEMWFAKETGLLTRALTTTPTLEIDIQYGDYADQGGILWPAIERTRRTERGSVILTASKLLSLNTNDDSYRDIGPVEVAAMLANSARNEGKKKPQKK